MHRLLVVTGIALSALLPVSCGATRRPIARPNVVLVVMDTTRADRCSAYGYGKPTTPCLEALAAEGVLCADAWSPSPWTGPAHASLFTGLRPENHGFVSGPFRDYLAETPTLSKWFRAAGYRTACFSNSPFVSPDFGTTQGFERVSCDFLARGRPYPYAEATHRSALAFAEGCHDRGERFLLFVNDIEPHAMYTPPEAFEAAFTPPGVDRDERHWGRSFPSFGLMRHLLGLDALEPRQIEVLSHLYDGEVACLDREVGALTGGLRRLGLLDDCVLVVLADHGELFGENGRVDHHGSLHRSLLRVPLVIRYPPAFPPGSVIEDVVRLEDVPPTLLDLCGIPEPEGLDGESLLGATGGRLARAVYHPPESLLDALCETWPREVVSSGFARGIQSVYDGRWQYVLHADGEEALYDLAVDPAGTTDLSSERPGEVARLTGLLPLPPASSGLRGADPVR